MTRLLGLLGLGLRGRLVAVGVDAVRVELRSGGLRCVVLAADASPRAMEKVVRLADARGIPLVPGPAAAAIGARRAPAGDGGGRQRPRTGRRNPAGGVRA